MTQAAWRYQDTSSGQIIVASTLAVVDQQPELLTCGVPVYLEDELPRLRSLAAAERAADYQRRTAALADEAVLRAENSRRNVWMPDTTNPQR